MKKVFIIVIVGLLALGCETEYYKLSVFVDGNGTYKIEPEKNEYEDGETVTISAFPDSGWKFRRWDGNTQSTKTNPLKLVMDGKKEITTVFGIPIEPNLTDTWEGEQYVITFNIKQPDEFEPDLNGSLTITTISGSKLDYSVTGNNNSPFVQMTCKKSGYYDVRYTGSIENENYIEGYFTEAGVHYDCNLIRTTEVPFNKERIEFVPTKIKK